MLDKLREFFKIEKKPGTLEARIAPRRETSEGGLYKVLDRDKFYARQYSGTKSPMNLIDISTTGVAFKTDFPIPRGSFVELELRKLSGTQVVYPPIIVSCETIYCMPIGEPFLRVGTKFLDIKIEDAEKIRGYTEVK